MNKKLEKYFEDISMKISESGITFEEVEIYKSMLDIFEELYLISKNEKAHWCRVIMNGVGNKRIESLNLSIRSYKALIHGGIMTTYQLREKILNRNLLNVKNIGVQSGKCIIKESVKKGIIKQDEIPQIYKVFLE